MVSHGNRTSLLQTIKIWAGELRSSKRYLEPDVDYKPVIMLSQDTGAECGGYHRQYNIIGLCVKLEVIYIQLKLDTS